MIASGWRTAPPQVSDFEVVLATNSACSAVARSIPSCSRSTMCRPTQARPRAREGLSCSNTSHRSSSLVHALPHPASCPLHGEPSLAMSQVNSRLLSVSVCRSHLKGRAERAQNVERNLHHQYAARDSSRYRRKRRPNRNLLRARERIHPRRLHLQRQSHPRPPGHAVLLRGHRPRARRLPLHHRLHGRGRRLRRLRHQRQRRLPSLRRPQRDRRDRETATVIEGTLTHLGEATDSANRGERNGRGDRGRGRGRRDRSGNRDRQPMLRNRSARGLAGLSKIPTSTVPPTRHRERHHAHTDEAEIGEGAPGADGSRRWRGRRGRRRGRGPVSATSPAASLQPADRRRSPDSLRSPRRYRLRRLLRHRRRRCRRATERDPHRLAPTPSRPTVARRIRTATRPQRPTATATTATVAAAIAVAAISAAPVCLAASLPEPPSTA